MKISKETLIVLKNFAAINNSLAVTEPQTIFTAAPGGSLHAIFDTKEKFPKFGIYEMSELLAIISLFDLDNTDFDFQETHVVITFERNRVVYAYMDPDILPVMDVLEDSSQDYKTVDGFDGSFDLTATEIGNLQKASNIMNLEYIIVKMKEGKGIISLIPEGANHQKDTASSFDMKIKGEGKIYVKLRVENLQIIPGNYKVSVINKMSMKFQHDKLPLFYFAMSQTK
jgi:hypothetical protein